MANKTGVKIGQDIVQVDPQLLFQRLLHVAGSDSEILEDIFFYELTNTPASLFDSTGFPREASKHLLANHLWSPENEGTSAPKEDVHHVIDGGALLHKLPWPRQSTYAALCNLYVTFVTRNYASATVVFDGYSGEPSTKDITHLRRGKGSVGRHVKVAPTMSLCERKEAFLANSHNKQQFINLCCDALRENGVEVLNAPGDADCLIVKKALESASQVTTVVIGDDTDLLVLLLHHFKESLKDIFLTPMQSGPKKKTWNIRENSARLGHQICDNLLFAHAFCGCDTTSRPHNMSKSQPVKNLKNKSFLAEAQILKKNSSHEEVAKAGERVFVMLYNGKPSDSLQHLRFVRYSQKVSTSSKQVQPKSLPPSPVAAEFHAYRTYYQVKEWQCLGNWELKLDPLDWGWEKQNGLFVPTMTNKPAAPENLLYVIRCACKTDCSNYRCSCRKHGLSCTSACGECRGVSCCNGFSVLEEDWEVEEN